MTKTIFLAWFAEVIIFWFWRLIFFNNVATIWCPYISRPWYILTNKHFHIIYEQYQSNLNVRNIIYIIYKNYQYALSVRSIHNNCQLLLLVNTFSQYYELSVKSIGHKYHIESIWLMMYKLNALFSPTGLFFVPMDNEVEVSHTIPRI